MNRPETILFGVLVAFYLLAFGLYHWMVFRVNRFLPPGRRIPHSLYWGGWSELRDQYQQWYPRSSVYRVALASGVMCVIVAVALLAFRVWEYVTNR